MNERHYRISSLEPLLCNVCYLPIKSPHKHIVVVTLFDTVSNSTTVILTLPFSPHGGNTRQKK